MNYPKYMQSGYSVGASYYKIKSWHLWYEAGLDFTYYYRQEDLINNTLKRYIVFTLTQYLKLNPKRKAKEFIIKMICPHWLTYITNSIADQS